MKSNYQMLLAFEDFKPENKGFINMKEAKQIAEHFHIEERSDVELQNLRDFVVMYYGHKKADKDNTVNALYIMDKMSAIVYVIDEAKQRFNPLIFFNNI